MTAIIPTKDQAPELLNRAVESALASGVAEVLVIVDRSQPSFKPADRVRLLASPGEGISAALNEGIREARTTYLAFLDSDDAWLPGKSVQLAADYPASFTDYVRHGAIVRCDRPLDSIYTDNIPCRSTTVIRKDLVKLVGVFDESLPYMQDHDFNVRVFQHVGWTRIPYCLAQIADLPSGHTRTADTIQRNRCRAIINRRYRAASRQPVSR